MVRFVFAALLASIFVCKGTPAVAAIVYSEAVDGELSTENDSPTDLGIFTAGANTVTGQVTAIGFFPDLNFSADIFRFQIAEGSTLNSITMESFSTGGGPGGMFMMLDDSGLFPFSIFDINDPFFNGDISPVLGGTIVGGSDVGQDILDNLQISGALGNGQVFDVPLGAGEYSVYLQETGSFSNYSLAFNVTAVPEPTSLAVLGCVAAGLAYRRLRRKAI